MTMGMGPGQKAVAAAFGAAVWDYIEDSPMRRRDDVLAYEHSSNDCQEMAENAAAEERAKVRKALDDKEYALSWARRIKRTGEMDSPWNRLSAYEKLHWAREQEYEASLKMYRALVADGRFENVRAPSKTLSPDKRRAFDEAQEEWLETSETPETQGAEA